MDISFRPCEEFAKFLYLVLLFVYKMRKHLNIDGILLWRCMSCKLMPLRHILYMSLHHASRNSIQLMLRKRDSSTEIIFDRSWRNFAHFLSLKHRRETLKIGAKSRKVVYMLTPLWCWRGILEAEASCRKYTSLNDARSELSIGTRTDPQSN